MRVLSAISVLLLAAMPVSAATICVEPSGVLPCLATIQAGIDAALGGDTVQVAAGTYHEAPSIPTGKNGLTLSGSAKKTIIDGTGLNDDGLSVAAANVKLSNLVIRHSDDTGILVEASATGTIISGVIVQNTEDDGIQVHAGGVAITACKIFSGGSQCIDGEANQLSITATTAIFCDDGCVHVSGDDVVVSGNKFSQCEDQGAVKGGGDRVSITDNQLSLAEDGVDWTCSPCTAGRIAGNKISDSQDNNAGIYVNAQPSGMLIEENTISNSTDAGIIVSGTNVTVNNNTITHIGDGPASCLSLSGSGHHVEGNSISDCHGDGIAVSGNGMTVTGNSASNCVQDGIDVDGDNNQITDNKTQGNGYEGIDISIGTTNNTVTGNTSAKNRADYCDAGDSTTTSSNKFGTTSPCSLD